MSGDAFGSAIVQTSQRQVASIVGRCVRDVWGEGEVGQSERCLLFVGLAAQRLSLVCTLSSRVFVTGSARVVFDLHATNKQRVSLARLCYEFLDIHEVWCVHAACLPNASLYNPVYGLHFALPAP